MGLFTRTPKQPARPGERAVPLTPADVLTLVNGYTEKDRLTRINRADTAGTTSWYRDLAVGLMRAAALAAHLGHDTVPMRVNNLHDLESVRDVLLRHAPHAESTRAFEVLELKLHALSALATRREWWCTYDPDAWCYRWVTPVAVTDLAAIPQIGNATAPQIGP